MSRQWPDMFFGKVVGGTTNRRPVPAKSPAPVTAPVLAGVSAAPQTFGVSETGGVAVLAEPNAPTARIPLPSTVPGFQPTPPPKPATTGLVTKPAPVAAPGQWPHLFFGTTEGPRVVSLPEKTVPTSMTARIPLSQLPPGAQPPYLAESKPSAPPPTRKPASTQWPGMFFGSPEPLEKTPAPPAPIAPVAAAPAPMVIPAANPLPYTPTPPPKPARPQPTEASPLGATPAPVPTFGANSLTPFLTPLGQRSEGISKITFPGAAVAKAPEPVVPGLPVVPPTPPAPVPVTIPAPADVVPPVRPAQPPGVPSPVAPPVSVVPVTPAPGPVVVPAAAAIPSTVVLPPAFATGTPEPEVEPVRATTASTPEVQREFLLNNGERVSGRVVSETNESIYLHSDALGVLTIARGQLAKQLREVILLNGDRIIGDVIAETDEVVYIRNASLGTLTIPKSHSSQKVIEVILKNGDRVVGELITENDELVLIKSATLGTISVTRKSLQMINRRLEHHPIKPLAE